MHRVDTAASITPLCDRVLFRITVVQALVCAFVWLAVAPAGGQAANGRIEGQVKLVLPPASAVPSGVYPSRRVSKPQPKTSEISNVIVFLKDAPHRGEPVTMSVTIAQKDEAFVPRVVAITRGSTIDFPNSDPFFHNVFSLSRGANFDLGRYPRGVSKFAPVPECGAGEGLLSHSLAHDREHHGVRPPLLPDSLSRRHFYARRRAGGQLPDQRLARTDR